MQDGGIPSGKWQGRKCGLPILSFFLSFSSPSLSILSSSVFGGGSSSSSVFHVVVAAATVAVLSTATTLNIVWRRIWTDEREKGRKGPQPRKCFHLTSGKCKDRSRKKPSVRVCVRACVRVSSSSLLLQARPRIKQILKALLLLLLSEANNRSSLLSRFLICWHRQTFFCPQHLSRRNADFVPASFPWQWRYHHLHIFAPFSNIWEIVKRHIGG